MVILACLLLILLLVLLAAFVYYANRMIEDSSRHIPNAVRWLLRTCGDQWWAPPAAWVVIVLVPAFLVDITVGTVVTALACAGLGGFCSWASRNL